jgi:hypothetical protein
MLRMAAAVLLLACACTGCANVKPWERAALARRDMSWDPDPLEAQLDSHIRFSKEAALPGGSAGGGGCGCN